MTLDIYPDKLFEELVKSKFKYIPRKLRQGEKLRLFKRYWIPDYGIVKVKEIYDIGEGHYCINYGGNGCMYGVIPYPVPYINCYELLHNYNKFEDNNFINKRKPVYGAEIKYWFVYNKIDFDNENYSGFLDKIQYIHDSSKYLVRRNKKKKIFEFEKVSKNKPMHK